MPSEVRSLDDLAMAILYSMQNGSGCELMIESQLAESLASLFPWNYRMGGNAGNISNVLAALGAEPVVNVPSLTPRQASLFRRGVKVPAKNDAKLVEPREACSYERELIHFVIQYRNGETVETPVGLVRSPRANRIIASYDPLNRTLYLNPDFREWLKEPDPKVRGVLLSGFHLVPYDLRYIFEERLEIMRDWLVDRYSHIEMGSFERPEIMMHLLKVAEVDSIGMNEEELAMIRPTGSDWFEIADAAKWVHDEFDISRVCVHTRDFTLSISPDPKKEIAALKLGAEIAGGLAATGSICKTELDVSARGRAAVDELLLHGGRRAGMGAFKPVGESNICIHPSFIARDPVTTVGLGDALTAAVLYKLVTSSPA